MSCAWPCVLHTSRLHAWACDHVTSRAFALHYLNTVRRARFAAYDSQAQIVSVGVCTSHVVPRRKLAAFTARSIEILIPFESHNPLAEAVRACGASRRSGAATPVVRKTQIAGFAHRRLLGTCLLAPLRGRASEYK